MSSPRFATKNEMVLCSVCNERYAVFIDHLNPAHKELNRCHMHLTEAMSIRYNKRMDEIITKAKEADNDK